MRADSETAKILLKLRLASASVPYHGLFFWLSLLLPAKVDYEALVEEKFAPLLEQLITREAAVEQVSYYATLAEDLKYLREQVKRNPEVKAEVVRIKDAIVENLANGAIMEGIYAELP